MKIRTLCVMSVIWGAFMMKASSAFAQTAGELGQVFQTSSERIFEMSANEDSLKLLNSELLKYLEEKLPLIPASLTSDFSIHGWGSILSSVDRKLRLWSWDDGSGGHLSGAPRNEITLAEFLTPNGIKTLLIESPNLYHRCDTIFSVRGAKGKLYYVLLFVDEGDFGRCRRSIEAYAIEDTTLNTSVPLFQTKKALQYSLAIDFRCGNVWEPHNFRVIDNGKTILVPHISKQGKMTRKDDRYEFNGRLYVFRKTVTFQ